MKPTNFIYKNGLSLAFLALFLFSIIGQACAGWQDYNEFLRTHDLPETGFGAYLHSGHFIQATFENWESEFLQMGLFVVLTISLKQLGSSESKPLDDGKRSGELKPLPDSPKPVKKGGFALWIYQYSLSIALFSIFIASFALHLYGCWKNENLVSGLAGKPGKPVMEILGSSRFWFESFQNWQSEFLSVFALVFLSIYLRQKGSPQSKKVNAPHTETGE